MAGLAKKIWIIANWKSNKNIAEALDWVSIVGPKIPKSENLQVVVCPTFSALSEVKKIIQVNNFNLMVGSQDLSPFPEGAYTGEEAAKILKEVVELSILGHSERRKNFSETDEMVANKVKQALDNNIVPLVCVQDENTPISADVKLVAYEPIFAIGTGNPDTPENANEIAKSLKQKYPELEILYGGSVNSGNIVSFIRQQDINGALIGGASLDPEEFIKILKECVGETS